MLWRLIHNAVIHPLLALVELLERLVTLLHDWTADLGFGVSDA